MAINLTKAEQKLLAHAKKAIVKYNTQRHARGDTDTTYAFVLSDSGKIFDSACFEVADLGHGNICAEGHAISNMVMAETYKAK